MPRILQICLLSNIMVVEFPPDENISQCFDTLDIRLKSLIKTKLSIVLGGDFNILLNKHNSIFYLSKHVLHTHELSTSGVKKQPEEEIVWIQSPPHSVLVTNMRPKSKIQLLLIMMQYWCVPEFRKYSWLLPPMACWLPIVVVMIGCPIL